MGSCIWDLAGPYKGFFSMGWVRALAMEVLGRGGCHVFLARGGRGVSNNLLETLHSSPTSSVCNAAAGTARVPSFVISRGQRPGALAPVFQNYSKGSKYHHSTRNPFKALYLHGRFGVRLLSSHIDRPAQRAWTAPSNPQALYGIYVDIHRPQQ